MRFVCENLSQTEALGTVFAHILKRGDFVALRGEIGTGKTALVRAVAAELGDVQASSPTFTIVHEYQTIPPIFHMDMYRLAGVEDLNAIGYSEYENRGGVILMEWPERVEEILPPDRYEIAVSKNVQNENSREISLTALGKKTCMLALITQEITKSLEKYSDQIETAVEVKGI